MRSRSVALLVLVLSMVVVPTAALAQDSASTASDLTIEQLSQGGEHPENAPPSVRSGGTYSEYAVKTLPTHLLTVEGEDSPMWSYMQSKETVNRNHVQLHARRGFGVDDKNVTVRIAYWQAKQIKYEDDNGTVRSRTVATNVTTHSVNANIEGGYADPVRIDLHPHYDEKVRMTMCVEEEGEDNCLANPNGVRWIGYHSSVKSAKPIETNSEGARLAWAIGIIGIPFGGFSMGFLWCARRAVRAARARPNISLLVWVLGIIATVVVALIFWRTVSGTLIRAPWAFSAAVGAFAGLVAAEWFGDDTYLAAFLRLRVKDAIDSTAFGGAPDDSTSPIDVEADVSSTSSSSTKPVTDGGLLPLHRRIESFRNSVSNAPAPTPAADRGTALDVNAIPGQLTADIIPFRMVRGSDGSRSAVVNGFWKFVARFRGARADMEVDGNPRTKIDVEQGPYEELYLLDPESEQPIEHKPEGHRFEWPDIITRDDEGRLNIDTAAIAGITAVLGASYIAGGVLLDSSQIGVLIGGFLAFAWKVLQPEEGYFHVDLAPVHYGNALATVIGHAGKLGDVSAWQTMYERLHGERASNRAENKALSDKASTSQMDTIADRYVGGDDE